MRSSDVWVSPEAIAALLAASKSTARIEPCGVLIGFHVPRGAEVVRAVPLRNVHPSPERGFLIEPDAILLAGRAARAAGFDVVGFWHAHLEGPAWPGTFDEDGMRAAHADGIGPYVHIVSGKGTTGKSVLRAFRMGRSRARQIALHTLRRALGSQRLHPPSPSLI